MICFNRKIPANRKHLYCIYTMLDQRRRHQADVVFMLLYTNVCWDDLWKNIKMSLKKGFFRPKRWMHGLMRWCVINSLHFFFLYINSRFFFSVISIKLYYFRLYQSPKRSSSAEKQISPYKWVRQEFEHPSPEVETARRVLLEKLDEVAKGMLPMQEYLKNWRLNI